MLDGLLETLRLKALRRAGLVRKNVPDPESVADHSWGVAWLVMVLLPPTLNRERALAYAVLHDVPEVRAGDITPADGVTREDKARREDAAMVGLCGALNASGLLRTWRDYEAQNDDEARFVRQLDRLDMALQALWQHQDGVQGMLEFVTSADQFITHEALRPVMDTIVLRMKR